MAKARKRKPKPLSKWAKSALKEINKKFPSKEESQHPFVVITRLLVIAKDCGIDVSKLFEEPAPGSRGRHDKPQS